MEWDSRMDLAWKRAFASAEKYYQEHGNLLVPNRYKTDDGFSLGQWVCIRRQKYLDGELTTDQIRQLEAIGMVWDAVSARWEKGYEPKYCQWSKLIPYQQMVKNVADARIVITHGGARDIIGSTKRNYDN